MLVTFCPICFQTCVCPIIQVSEPKLASFEFSNLGIFIFVSNLNFEPAGALLIIPLINLVSRFSFQFSDL